MPRATADQIAEELRHAISALRRRVRVESERDALSYPLRSLLRRLEDGAATTADLARAEHVTPQSAGALVAKLEDDGLVARKDDAGDGRRRLVAITAAGRKAIAARRADRQSWLAQRVATALDAGEQRQLAAALALLRKVVEG